MRSQASSPLLGYNSNVRHKGKVFHIQTEDSGVRYGHVITHLFVDGGRILKSVKTSYAEHATSDHRAEIVRDLMKRQHQAMFAALREGRFDAMIEDASLAASVAVPVPPARRRSPAPPTALTTHVDRPSPVPPARRRSPAPPTALTMHVDRPSPVPPAMRRSPVPPAIAPAMRRSPVPPAMTPAMRRSPAPPAMAPARTERHSPIPPPAAVSRRSPVPPAPAPTRADRAGLMPPPTAARADRRSPLPPRGERTPSGSGRAAKAHPIAEPLMRSSNPPGADVDRKQSASRPTSAFGQARPQHGRSIFGDAVTSDKSLDDVILTFLAADGDDPKSSD